MHIKRIIVVILSLSIIGCSSLHRINVISQDSLKRELAPGDRVTVIDKNGRESTITIKRIALNGLYSSTADEEGFIPYEDIREIRHERISAAKTVGAGALGTALFVVLVVVLGSAVLSEAASD